MVPTIGKLNPWKSKQNEGHFDRTSNGFGQNDGLNLTQNGTPFENQTEGYH